ncbi:MAG: phosphate ABC transporter permease PstA [Pyrinomonadaceae bacterium]
MSVTKTFNTSASDRARRTRRLLSSAMTTITALCALCAVTILLLILGYITIRGIGAINFQFLIETPKPVGEGGGIGNAILGTFMLIGIGSLFGLPIGIGAGIYLAEFGDNKYGKLIRFIADTLTGVPSIIIGVFVYTLVVIPMQRFSALAGSIALGLIMIPIVTRTSEEIIRLVPTSLREGALALGAPQWKVTLGIVLPAAATGIATGSMLAVARVSGETAPLLFTAFGSRFFNQYLDQPTASLTAQIYNYAISPYDEWHRLAWAATLVLMALILVINISVRFFTRKRY